MKDAMGRGGYRWGSGFRFGGARILACLFVAGTAFAGDVSTYRSSTSEVRITFFATDRNSRPVSAISKSDFVVVDGEDVVRNFRSLVRSQETELNLVIVVDASGSMSSRLPAALEEVINLLLQNYTNANSAFSIISFSGFDSTVLCERDCESLQVRQRLLSLRAEGSTPLFDAIAFGAEFLSRRSAPDRRPVLIVFSDGGDSASKISMQDALQSVSDAGSLLYAVEPPTINAGKQLEQSEGSATLKEMAEATGGRYVTGEEESANLIESILEDLRASYVVTYRAPAAAAGFRPLHILPKHDRSLRFHCRNGYYHGGGAPQEEP